MRPLPPEEPELPVHRPYGPALAVAAAASCVLLVAAGDGDVSDALRDALRFGLAAVFLVAAAAKLADLRATREALGRFRVPDRLAAPAAPALPAVELVVAVLLVPTATARPAALGAAVLLAAFSVAWLRADRPDCNCFGALGEATDGRPLARNVVLIAAALVVAFPAAGVAVALGASLAAAGLWARIRARRTGVGGASVLEVTRSTPAPALPTVPPVGSPAPPFALPTHDGEWITLPDLLVSGRPVALIFSDPACAACDTLPATLARLRSRRTGTLEMALITRGPDDGDGPFAPVLLQSEHEVARAYAAGHVPSALIVDGDGRVASELVAGELAIEALLLGDRDLAEVS